MLGEEEVYGGNNDAPHLDPSEQSRVVEVIILREVYDSRIGR